MIEKYTFDLHIAKDIDTRMILVKAESEQRNHVVMKMLAYLLFYDPGLYVERDIGLHYKPDLVILDDRNRPELWIDCGYVAMEKAKKIAQKLRNTRIVLIKETRSQMQNFKRQTDKKVEHAARLEYLAFEPGFVAGIAAALDKINDVTLYPVMENVIGIAMNDQVFESELFR